MDLQEKLDILSGQRRGWRAAALRGALLAASRPYAAAVRVRRWAYRRGVLPSRRAGVPVICVGNLTTGGTGKTPMVAWIVRHLKEAGRRPAVLTRGYKAVDGKSDEAEMLRQLCGGPGRGDPAAAVIVNADRVAGAKAAVAAGADVLVMDDGFQHLRLRRDLDIVLIDVTCPFGYGHCLPRGLLREPVSALRFAGAILITHSDAAPAEQLAELKVRLRGLAPRASLHAAMHRPVRIIADDGHELPLGALVGRKVCAFCGIGRSDHFFGMLGQLLARPVDTIALADHAAYGPREIDAIRNRVAMCNADLLVTTQKDFVKLTGVPLDRPVWQLAVELDVVEGRRELLETIAAAIRGDTPQPVTRTPLPPA